MMKLIKSLNWAVVIPVMCLIANVIYVLTAVFYWKSITVLTLINAFLSGVIAGMLYIGEVKDA